jgi:iron complex outermembrane recepter protein
MRVRTMLVWLVPILLCCALPMVAQPPAQEEPTQSPPDEGTEQSPPEAPPDEAAETVSDTITVVGIADALQEAVEVKREADAIVDAVVAEDVGKLPDKNLAEAVQRVPGVVINREFGEGERVSVRGVAPTLVRTTLNGHNVAVADWFVLEQLAATRSFNYLLLPSEMIGLLKVYKSPTADIDEGGIGGTIDVQTRKPLDLDSFSFIGSLQNAYTENSDSNDPNGSALFNWKNRAGNVGVLFSGVYETRDIRRDGVEVLGYFTDPTTGLQVPSLIGSALFQQERERKAFNAEVQLRPTDRLDVRINGLHSRFEADNINQNYLAWASQALGGGGTLSDVVKQGDTAVAGTISSKGGGTEGRGVVFDAIDRFAFAETWYADFDATYKAADNWLVHFDTGYTLAEGDTESQPFVEFGAPAAFRYDLRGSTPQVTFLNVDPANPTDMEFDFASLHNITNDDDELYAYLDAETFLSHTNLESLKFGVKYTDHERKTDFQATTFGSFFLPLLERGCNGRQCTPADFAGGLTPSDFLNGIGAPGTLSRYWSVNRGLVESILSGSFNGGRIPLPSEVFAVQEAT